MNINITAPVNTLGYGCAGMNLLKALDAIGVDVTWWPIGQPDELDQDHSSSY